METNEGPRNTKAQAPLIAVCTPVYNGEKYLAETMECVQSQTYPNIVHVILDNASTDATPEIISRYLGRRVPLIVARNPATIPAFDNFNQVLKLVPAEAEYFCMLYADDLLLPRALESMSGIVQQHEDVALVAAAQPDDKWGGWPAGDVFPGREIAAEYLRGNLPASFAHCLYRRSALSSRGPEFFDKRINSLDIDVALATMRDAKVGYVHEPVVVTREHQESISARDFGDARLHHAEWLVLFKRYGHLVLEEKEARQVERRFKRYYLRRMLRWQFVDRNVDRVRRHLQRLEIAKAQPTLFDYLDAVLDWPVRKLGLRPHWDKFGY